ncbi:MAG: peptidylprolyl isomerase [Oscillospiraceae bacterium]|jgi:hypothetical protein|nr:peptidylprolyl isomerase [Oscillospiraceae bacterium]
MNFKKLLAILLCLCLVFALLAGCTKDSEDDDDNGNDDDIPSNGDVTNGSGVFDADAAFATFSPDTVMISAGDITITWAELYIFLFGAVADYSQDFFIPINWDEELFDDKTISDLILELATNEALQVLVFEHAAMLNGVSLSESDLAMFDDELASMLEFYGSKEEMEQEMFELYGIPSIDIFMRIMKAFYLYEVLLSELFGFGGEKLSDADAAAYAEQQGFMRVKHILIMKSDEDDDDDDRDPLAEAEEVLEMLDDFINDLTDEYRGTLEEFFTELMLDYSKDPGSIMSPEGYLFRFEDMVEPFSEASADLKIGEISGLVETVYGYHIILRLPIDYDMVPMAYAIESYNIPLRMIAAYELFGELLETWREELEYEFSPEYKSIVLSDIFAW